jgi:deazaflavin-dependent oxidoreductase (nitroreductase family)
MESVRVLSIADFGGAIAAILLRGKPIGPMKNRRAFQIMRWMAERRRMNALMPQILRYGGWLAMFPWRMAGINSLLLTSIGRKSKKPRTTLIAYVRQGEDLIVMAPFARSGKSPHWYLNLMSDPRAMVEIVWRRREVTAEEIMDESEKSMLLRFYPLGLLSGLSEETISRIPVIRIRPS